MKVMHLDSGLDWRGGQQQVYSLVTGLAKRQVSQFLVLRRKALLAQRLQDSGIPLGPLPLRFEWDLFSLLKLSRILRTYQPEIVHVHDSRTLGLLALLRMLGLPAKVIAARRVAFPTKKNLFWNMKYRKTPSKIVAVSRFVQDLLIRSGVDPEQIEVVYDGFDLNSLKSSFNRENARKKLGVPEEALLIGCVGQFTAEKGHEFLIRGFAKVKQQFSQAHMILIGDGGFREQYLRQVHQLGLNGQVHLPGFLPDLTEAFAAMDLFVFPSLEEGLGSTLLSAMAHSIPVCASTAGGIPELVIEGQTGFLFPPGNSEALAETVVRALRMSEHARACSQEAHSRVMTSFSMEQMVESTLRIYANVLKQ